VVGIHVAAPLHVESLASPKLTDAARRLGGSDVAAFHELCGEGFVAARAVGGQWIAEVEVDPADAPRAAAKLTTGTWSEPEPFQAALEQLVAGHRVTARVLPDGDRARAEPIATEGLAAHAAGFPATLTEAEAVPYLATFAPYTEASLSGVLLPDAEALDPRDVAALVFRGTRAATSERASRAAEMRAAQVQREPEPASGPESPLRAPFVLDDSSLRSAPAASAAAPRAGAAAAPVAVHKVAALVFDTAAAIPVYATTSAPAGVYAEQVRQRAYWVPGAATGSLAVTGAIAEAKEGTPTRGTTVVVAESGGTTVVLTDAGPVAGVHAEPAGERRAWIAGVVEPDAVQRAALAAAVAAAD
jgi:hypothetical protein